MPLLVKKNIRTLGQRDLLGPALAVEKIELVTWYRKSGQSHEYELFHLEDGSCRRPDELIFVDMNEELLIAMRMEATILAKDKKR